LRGVFAQLYIGINLILIVFLLSALLRAERRNDVVLCIVVCGDDCYCDHHEICALVEAQSSDDEEDFLSSKWRKK
jgi:hypothetical protein